MDTAASNPHRSESVALRDAPGDSAVTVRGLNYYFGEGEGRKQALFDVNLDLKPGQIIIMTGPSGSGKTTLLTLIGALRSVQEGSIRVMGHELMGLSKRERVAVRRGIGFVFQAHNLFEPLTAFQNVKMALELKTSDRKLISQKATDILKVLGLGQRTNYRPASLSGGQKQRVAIARALVNRPKLILADEPTAALDAKSGQDAVNLFKNLASEDACTILLVTHDSRILDAADRIVNMVDGRLESDVMVAESTEICEFLRNCPVFDGLSPSALADIADQMASQTCAAGTTICRQGEPGEKFYVIRGGRVDVLVTDGDAENVVATLGRGDFFGEVALLADEPRNATVVAREDAELFTLDRPHFQTAVDGCISFKEELLNVFSQRYRGRGAR